MKISDGFVLFVMTWSLVSLVYGIATNDIEFLAAGLAQTVWGCTVALWYKLDEIGKCGHG